MATLTFDGNKHTLTLFDGEGAAVRAWPANNVVDSKISAIRYIPNGHHKILDQKTPNKHHTLTIDKLGIPVHDINGMYGRFGTIRLERFAAGGQFHNGIAVHAGRINGHAQNHATDGCIRTTDAAMGVISAHMRNDPLVAITVRNNHEQNSVYRH